MPHLENSRADAVSLRRSLGVDETVVGHIRAVGERLAARVPELVEDFYGWLAPFPEFAQFFTDDHALLTHVKSHQTAYWRDFLRAEVDDDYVGRRRRVGQVHARIELGLLIYLRAMEFVAAWLVKEIDADPRFERDRAAVRLSIRKLIHFDSAIVVHTYATRTAQLLDEQRTRLDRVAGVMRAVTEGDLERGIELTEADDVLGRSVNDMVRSLRGISQEMRTIAQGDYSADVAPRSERDQLGTSLQAMTRALRQASEENQQHLWISTCLAELGQAMSGNPTTDELSEGVVTYLCRALGAQVGTMYVLDESSDSLRLSATYATRKGEGVPERWRRGEGLVGQVAVEKQRIVVRDLPEGGLRIRWGFGECPPRALALAPLMHDDMVRGVIEVGALTELTPRQLELLDRAASQVGLAISAAETRAHAQQLLEESQVQAEELGTQQDELRAVNEALEEQTRALEEQKESLMATQTVLRQKASELELASRYKSEFLANMSHELRTPLNSSLILAKLLSENRHGNLNAEQVKYAQSIYSSGNDLLTLINDILDLSKIEAGHVELHREWVDIAHLFGDLRQRFEPLAAEKGLELTLELESGSPAGLQTDAQRVLQILTNLLGNAVKFTDRGSIELRAAAADGQQVMFSVRDTGIGIRPDKQQAIFEAFSQADGTTSRRYGGTGLGLSICRELASLLGGEVRVQSAPGEGSTFSLLLPVQPGEPASATASASRADVRPLAQAESPASGVASEPPEPVSERPLVDDDRDQLGHIERWVLVVEDDPAFAAILRDVAREKGFACVVAKNAEEGLWFAREHGPLAVLLDVGLPDRSGLTVIEALKRHPETRHIPVHVTSAHDHTQLAREMGAVGYLLKPVTREALSAMFETLQVNLTRSLKSVLVVEDDTVQRDAMERLLQADGVEVMAVPSAVEALALLRQRTFDCVVVDLMLPDVSGFDLLDRMSEDETCGFPPVIVYTARMLSPDEEQRLRRCSRSIIVKGARSPERLLEEVTLFLHQIEAELPADKRRMLATARSGNATFGGRRVLIVEDDIRNVFALSSALEEQGLVIDVARNGREALERLAAGPSVDLILMDVMMPEMDGLTATREIRKDGGDGGDAVPIIALTAKAMPDDREQCLAAGANDYIAKPVDVDKLMSLMRVWMPQ